jgi:outer membrane protein TolC
VQARETLGVLMGVNGSAVDVTSEPPEGQLPAAPVSLDQVLRGAREQRTDIKVGRRQVKAADHSLNMTYTEYLPTLSALFEPFLQSVPGVTSVGAGWEAQLLLSVPLYDGSQRYGLTHERQAALTWAQLNLESEVRQVESDARASYEAVQRANAALQAAREAAKLAHETLSLANLAYRAGATNELEVIDAERQARDADSAAAAAEDNALQAELNLLNAAALFPKG